MWKGDNYQKTTTILHGVMSQDVTLYCSSIIFHTTRSTVYVLLISKSTGDTKTHILLHIILFFLKKNPVI